MSKSSRQITQIALSLLALLSLACSRETTVYPASAINSNTDTPQVTDGRPVLPQGFLDQSVNSASVDIALDATTATSVAIRVRTSDLVNSAGRFNGNGTGNRALLGYSLAHKKPLSSLDSITFDSKVIEGDGAISVLLQVDLKCDGSTPQILIAEGEDLLVAGAATAGYFRYTAKLTDNVWKTNQGEILSPSDSSLILLPSRSATSAASLEALLAEYPSACLVNAKSDNDDLPKLMNTAGIIFALGEADTSEFNGAFINRLSIGSDVFADLEAP